MTLDLQPEKLKERLDDLARARRQLTQSMDASGMKLRQAMGSSEDTPPAPTLEMAEPEPAEEWPRAIPAPSRFYPRVRVFFLVLTVIALVGTLAALQRRQPVPAAVSTPGAAAVPAAASTPTPASAPAPAVRSIPAVASTPAVTSLAEAPAGEPFDVYLKALRPCQAHIVVDGTALDWRQLQEGDEFVSHPAHDILIETNDAGALTATINRRSIRLGDDGTTVAVRLNSQNFQKFLVR
jgi:hypothetical protein